MTTEQNAAAEAVGGASNDSEKQRAADKGTGGDKLAAWSGFSLVLGLAGDMATPIGQYSLWFPVAGIIALVACFLLRRINFARRALVLSGVFAVLLSGVVVTDDLLPPQKKAEE